MGALAYDGVITTLTLLVTAFIWSLVSSAVMKKRLFTSFYKKSMSNQRLMIERSAMPKKIRRNALVQEVIRIEKHGVYHGVSSPKFE